MLEIDYTVKDLESRYSVTRSNVYNRINGLKAKGYDMEPSKQGNRALYSSLQVALMDRLDEHLKTGQSIDSFAGQDTGQAIVHKTVLQDSPTVRPTESVIFRNTSDSNSFEQTLTFIAQALAQTKIDPLEQFEHLERVAEKGWLLSTSQLAPLLGLKSLSGKEFSRYGFTFTRVGRNGVESAWRVGKGK